MQNNHKVCILLTNYNHKGFVDLAISSLLKQTYDNYEIYIFDDCSTDGSYEDILKIRSSKIKVFRNEKNLGFIDTLNNAKKTISISEFKYVYRVDSDDIYERSAIEKLVRYAEINECNIVGSFLKTFGSENSYYDFPCSDQGIKQALLVGSPVTHSGVLISSQYYSKVDYNKKFIYCEDYKLWVDLCRLGAKFGNVNEYLINYRKHDSNATMQSTSTQVTELLNNIRKEQSVFLRLDSMAFFGDISNYSYVNESFNDVKKAIDILYKSDNTKFINNFIISWLRRNSKLSLRVKLGTYTILLKKGSLGNRLFIPTVFISIIGINPDSKMYDLMKTLRKWINL